MAGKKNIQKRRKNNTIIDKGQVHIQCSYNNTIVTFTDLAGNAVSWSSSGKLGYRGSKKSTPLVAQLVTEDAAKVATDRGMRIVEVYIKGPGAGRETAIRVLQNTGLQVSLIKDVSPIPHNGCRAPKHRRL